MSEDNDEAKLMRPALTRRDMPLRIYWQVTNSPMIVLFLFMST